VLTSPAYRRTAMTRTRPRVLETAVVNRSQFSGTASSVITSWPASLKESFNFDVTLDSGNSLGVDWETLCGQKGTRHSCSVDGVQAVDYRDRTIVDVTDRNTRWCDDRLPTSQLSRMTAIAIHSDASRDT
jgi:hypothetical protein